MSWVRWRVPNTTEIWLAVVPGGLVVRGSFARQHPSFDVNDNLTRVRCVAILQICGPLLMLTTITSAICATSTNKVSICTIAGGCFRLCELLACCLYFAQHTMLHIAHSDSQVIVVCSCEFALRTFGLICGVCCTRRQLQRCVCCFCSGVESTFGVRHC